jgi:hypothetical protein
MLVSSRTLTVLTFASMVLLGQEARLKGVHPRATPEDYLVKAEGSNAAYAASLIPNEQVKHLFAFDISGKYLVFEIACFPRNGRTMPIDPDDFVLSRGSKGDGAHQVDASAVALAIQMEHLPRSSSHSGEIMTEAHVGYESGRDPVTGQRVSGVYGGGGVAATRGGEGRYPSDPPRPGGQPEDRRLLQSQLEDRQLPAGKFDHAVAGYLYFPKALAKKDGNGNYVLEHLGETNASGVSEKIDLVIPTKSR